MNEGKSVKGGLTKWGEGTEEKTIPVREHLVMKRKELYGKKLGYKKRPVTRVWEMEINSIR